MKPLAEVSVISPRDPPLSQAVFNERHKVITRGQYFAELVRSLMMTAVYTDVHVDGRQLCRNITPQEAVAKSEEVTQLLYEVLERRGWVLEMPALADLKTGAEVRTGF